MKQQMFSLCMAYLNFTPLWLLVLVSNFLSWRKGIDFNSVRFFIIVGMVLIFIMSLFIVHRLLNCVDSWATKCRCKVMCFEEEKTTATEFLLTFFLPLMGFNCCTTTGLLQIGMLFFVVALAFTRHFHVQGNLVLEVIGYAFYDCELEGEDSDTCRRKVFVYGRLDGTKGIDYNFYRLNNQMLFLKDKIELVDGD